MKSLHQPNSNLLLLCILLLICYKSQEDDQLLLRLQWNVFLYSRRKWFYLYIELLLQIYIEQQEIKDGGIHFDWIASDYDLFTILYFSI